MITRVLVAALIAAVTLVSSSPPATAQIPDIPDVPKISKKVKDRIKPEEPARSDEAKSAEKPDQGGGRPGVAEQVVPDDPTGGSDEPTVAKDFVHINAFCFTTYQKKDDVYSWVPRMEFRVNGPIESGSVLWVEFTLPSGPWVKFDCKTEETKKGYWYEAKGGARDIPEDQGSIHTGPVDFAIHCRNELQGTDKVIYKGRFNVAKVHSNETGEKNAEHWVYYVDHDWTLPIGYVYYEPESVRGWQFPEFKAAFWARGDPQELVPHLFYNGKEIGKIFLDDTPMGKATASVEYDITPSHIPDDSLPQRARWVRVECSFPNIKAWDKTGEKRGMHAGQKGEIHLLDKNPGEYEVKVLWKGKLARSMKFTVGPDGKVANTIARDNKLGSNRYIVPVKIIGEQDGNWNKDAWKTDAFYGNPPTGFTAVP